MWKIVALGFIPSLFFSTSCSLFDKEKTSQAVPGIYDVTSTLVSSTGDCSNSNTPDETNLTVEIVAENGGYTMYGLDDQNQRKVTIATSKNGSKFENSGPVMEIGNCTFYQNLVFDLEYDTDENEITTLFGTSSVRMTASCESGECNEFSDIDGTKR